MDNKNNSNSLANKRVFAVFLSLPIFILTWIFSNYLYALVLGIGSAILLYILFVWIPEDKLQKQLRRIRFNDSHRILKENRKLIQKVKSNILKSDLTRACEMADGLLTALEKESRHQGKVEESILPLLENMQKQIKRWMMHENRKLPLPKKDAEKLKGILLNYDALFQKYQEGGLRSDEFLTSLYHTETAMLELGIDINDLEEGA